MKITANIKLPQKVTAEMKKILVPVTGSFDEGYSAGYDKGHTDGHKAGYTEGEAVGLAEGAAAERVRWWNGYTDDGERTNFDHACRGSGWNADTFKPKRKRKIKSATSMFSSSGDIADDESMLDFSECTTANQCFYYSQVTRLGVMDWSSMSSAWSVRDFFLSANLLVSIEKFVFPKANIAFTNTFNYMYALAHFICEGTAYQSINFQWSPLNKPSIISVFSCLDNTVTGQTAVFSQTAVDNAFETSEGAADGSTSEEWLTLVASKPNWTVSLV